MGHQAETIPAAIGFRVKTGRATAVVLAGPTAAPRVLTRRAVDMTDPDVPESGQPYHAELELPAEEGAAVVRRATQAVRSVALRAVRALVKELRDGGHDLRGIGLVVGSDTDPTKLNNAHVRAHALEGRLFREVLEAGAQACALPCLVLVERDAYARAATPLRRSADDVKRIVAALGAALPGPWRAEEKMAAVAAWLALVR